MGREISNSIDNAIRSLYSIVILIEEDTLASHLIDLDEEFANLDTGSLGDYSEVYETFYKNIHPEDRDKLVPYSDASRIHELMSEHLSFYFDCRLRDAKSNYCWVRITLCNTMECESSRGEEYLLLVQDIAMQKQEEEKVNNELRKELFDLQSRYDALFEDNMTDAQTGCLNRKGMAYYRDIVLKDAIEHGEKLFVCVLDLNGLKHLNDTYGHHAGDIAIKTISDGLKLSVPEQAKIMRTGGDEFLILSAVENGFDFESEMEKTFTDFLVTYNKNSDNPFEVSASYGYVTADEDEANIDLDALIEEADQKMYRMKEKTDPYKR